MRIYGVLTEPGEKTMIFSLFGSNITSSHSWVIVQVNLTAIFGKIFFLILTLKLRTIRTWLCCKEYRVSIVPDIDGVITLALPWTRTGTWTRTRT